MHFSHLISESCLSLFESYLSLSANRTWICRWATVRSGCALISNQWRREVQRIDNRTCCIQETLVLFKRTEFPVFTQQMCTSSQYPWVFLINGFFTLINILVPKKFPFSHLEWKKNQTNMTLKNSCSVRILFIRYKILCFVSLGRGGEMPLSFLDKYSAMDLI